MALVTVDLQRDGTFAQMDEAELFKHEHALESDDLALQVVEYCLLGCEGQVHRTGVADALEYFCAGHVHRSVHAVLKRGISLETAQQGFR